MPTKCYKCDKCKEEVKEGDNYCSNCGHELFWGDELDEEPIANNNDNNTRETHIDDDKYDGVGFYLLGKKEFPPDIKGFNDHIRTSVRKYKINGSISEENLKLQRSTIYVQHYLYEIGKEKGDEISDLLDRTLFGIDKIYKEMLDMGVDEWDKEISAQERIDSIFMTMAKQPESFGPESVAFGVALGELAALYNIKEGNLYYRWDLDNDECCAVLNEEFVKVAKENHCGITLPTTIPIIHKS